MGAKTPGGPLELIEFERPPLGEDEVLVDVHASGMCHSDIHMVDNDWGEGQFPMVPGHEVIGQVVEVGPKVTKFKVGDRVGFGPQRDSCKACEHCEAKAEQLCSSFKGLYDRDFGGYATSIQVPERFTFHVPEGIPDEMAPLLCAGVTTYAPLHRHAKAGDRVGVVGIGGLGHVAVQYAAKMGCETVAISRSTAKEEEARSFGATAFLATSDAAAVKAAAGTFDAILCTAAAHFSVDLYLGLLKPRGKFILVGLPPAETSLTFKPFSLVGGEKQLVGSMIGGTQDFDDMLAFSAEKSVFPQVELLEFDDANTGFKKMRENTVRYRSVLKVKGYREKALAAKQE